MKSPIGKPNKAEKHRFERFADVGCICCRLAFGVYRDYEVHHLVQGNRRLGHWFSIPLCAAHHRGRMLSGLWTSIAQGSKAFSKVHGTEWDLWLKVQHMLELDDALPTSKLVARRLA